MSEQIAPRKMVNLTYRITDTDGLVLEKNDVPVSYLHGGHNEMFDKIERALEGKVVGDAVEVSLDPSEGFGEHNPNLTFTDAIDHFPPECRRLGAQVPMRNDQGDTLNFIVTRIGDGKLTADGNHPFAGKTVLFHILILGVRDASPDELRDSDVASDVH